MRNIDRPIPERLFLDMVEIEKCAKELSDITHELNNLLNTLNGYTELAVDAKNANNEEEYNFFKDKVFCTLNKKLGAAKDLADRLSKIQTQIAEVSK